MTKKNSSAKLYQANFVQFGTFVIFTRQYLLFCETYCGYSVTELDPFSSQSLYRGRGINQVPWSSSKTICHTYHNHSWSLLFLNDFPHT